ncbi:pyridoxamine 5'-phosphate oxidase [Propionibacteriaceae bacterium G1746]
MADLHSARRDYQGEPIVETDSPWTLFDRWFTGARTAQQAGVITEAAAMTVATADVDGQPSTRVLLLKAYSADFGPHGGFDFYSHATSRKGHQLEVNPRVALQFYWSPLNQQVRIEGTVEVKPRDEAEAYWHTRPLASQVAALVSHQSHPRSSRADLEQAFAEASAQYADQQVPCPPSWRGYRVSPHRIEFWQGLPGRLHDRVSYDLIDGQWQHQRLDP